MPSGRSGRRGAQTRPPGTKAVFGRDLRAAVPTLKRERPQDGESRDYIYVGLGTNHSAVDLGPLGPEATIGPRRPSGPSSSAMYSQHGSRADEQF